MPSAVARVLAADVLPFDHVRNAEAIRTAITESDGTAGNNFDFSPTLGELDKLVADLKKFYAAVEDSTVTDAEANETITPLSRTLTRLNLVADAQFDQDPATSRESVPRFSLVREFPRLNDDEQQFLRVQLKRAQNDSVSELYHARQSLPGAEN